MVNRACILSCCLACRAALTEQEAALAAAQQEQAENDAKLAGATARFAKALARLDDDRAAVAADIAEQVGTCRLQAVTDTKSCLM